MMLASKLGIENELYVPLIFSFYCPLEGWGYVRAVFGYASGKKIENYIQRLRFRLAHLASFVTHLYYSVEYEV